MAPIVARSRSISEVLKSLKLKPSGGNYQYVKRMIARHKLDCKHFAGQGWAKGKSAGDIGLGGRVLTNSEVFIQNSPVTSGTRLQKRLRRLGREYKCAECGISEWRGIKIVLDLDHRNGNNTDNRLENLRFLCPNCHRITNNWGVKNVSIVQSAGDNSLRS